MDAATAQLARQRAGHRCEYCRLLQEHSALRFHDYFFAAALEKVQPGGLVMFVTSRGTMDKFDSGLRELLSIRAEFLGAIRLPNDARFIASNRSKRSIPPKKHCSSP